MHNSSFTFRSKVVLVVAACLAAGCESRGTDEASRFAPPPPALAAGTHVDFALLKEKVLTPYCTSCHSEFETEDGVKPYVKPGDPGGSSLYLDVSTGDMPPGGPQLADTVVQIVSDYVADLGKAK
jgi:hypothetical protein